jgi:hypothetical protein
MRPLQILWISLPLSHSNQGNQLPSSQVSLQSLDRSPIGLHNGLALPSRFSPTCCDEKQGAKRGSFDEEFVMFFCTSLAPDRRSDRSCQPEAYWHTFCGGHDLGVVVGLLAPPFARGGLERGV